MLQQIPLISDDCVLMKLKKDSRCKVEIFQTLFKDGTTGRGLRAVVDQNAGCNSGCSWCFVRHQGMAIYYSMQLKDHDDGPRRIVVEGYNIYIW